MAGPPGYSRAGETEAERIDRNYAELLQELRVVQNGVQILFAFLLGIAFTNRFERLEPYQRGIYLVIMVSAACATVVLVAPAAIHRMLFRRRQKRELVQLTATLASTGLALLAITILSALLFVLASVINLTLGIVVTFVLALLIVALWFVLPREVRRRRPSPDLDPDEHGDRFRDPGTFD